jgi:hypothetical protein
LVYGEAAGVGRLKCGREGLILFCGFLLVGFLVGVHSSCIVCGSGTIVVLVFNKYVLVSVFEVLLDVKFVVVV